MVFRRFLLAASVSLFALNAQAGTVTFDTTTGTFDLGDGNSDFFGNQSVTIENGARVFTFDEIVMISDTINVVGNAPLIIRSRTNMLVIDTDVVVQPGQAGGGAGGTGGTGGGGGGGGGGGAGGAGGSGAGPEFGRGKTGSDGTDGSDGGFGISGTRGGDGFGSQDFGGNRGGRGGLTFGQASGGDGGAGGSGGFRPNGQGNVGAGSNGTAGDDGADGSDGNNGGPGFNNGGGSRLTAGSGGGGGSGGAGGSGGGGGGGGGGGSEGVGFPFQPNGVAGGPGGDGGDGTDGGDGGDGGAGGGAVALEALGFMRVFDSVLSANGEDGQAGAVASNTRDGGSPGFRVRVTEDDGEAGGAGASGGDGGLGGDGADGAGGGGGTVKLSASVLEINPGTFTPTEVSTSGGSSPGFGGGDGRFVVESNIDVDLNNIVQTGTRTETLAGPRDINPFILGDVETPFMLLSQGRNFNSDVGLAGFLSDTNANGLLSRGFLSDVPTDALGALLRLDSGFGGGDFIGFDVLLFVNLMDEIATGAGLGVDPLSGGTGFLADLPAEMAALSVFATLIPEEGTTFSAAFDGFGIFDVELAQGETQFILANVTAVPVPAAFPLLASVLVGFGVMGWRRRKRQA